MLGADELLQGRYKITRQLGQGGMGAVYEAEDAKQFGKIVALKEILTTLTNVSDVRQHELFRSAFEREAKILMQVDHEAFPQVIDYFSEVNRQFLVMQLIQGKDLNELLIKNNGAFPLAQVCSWADQLLDALDYLHTLNPPIIHRDIKPQNLKLTSRGKIKLLDFGIAKGVDKTSSVTITNATMVAATLHYSPSEQLLRVIDPITREALQMIYGEKMERVLEQNADLRSDIYSLAATLYHFLTNKAPVDSLKRTIEFWREKPDNLTPPNKLNPEIPQEISDWILKAMEIDREKRYSSALEMRNALHKAIAGKSRREEEVKRQSWEVEQEKIRIEREKLALERQNIEKDRSEHQRQVELERQRRAAFENQHPHDAATIVNLPSDHPAAPNVTNPGLTQSSFISPDAPIVSAESASNEVPATAKNLEGEITALSYSDGFGSVENEFPGKTEVRGATEFSYLDQAKLESINRPIAPTPQPEPVRTERTSNNAFFNNNVKWLIPLAALAMIFIGGIAIVWFILGNNSNKSEAKDSPANISNVNSTKSSAITETSSSPEANKQTTDVSKTPAKTPDSGLSSAPVETKNEPVSKSAPSETKRISNPVESSKPEPTAKPVKTPAPKPAKKGKKNMDCIFSDDCK